MKKSIIVIVLCVFMLACSSNDSNNLAGSKKIDMATGMNVVGNTGLINAVLGNPNTLIKLSLAEKIVAKKDTTVVVSDVIWTDSIVIYPTIVNDILSIRTTGEVENIWFVKTQINKNYNDVDFTTALSNDMYSEEEIKSVSLYDYDFDGGTSLTIDVSDFEIGIYKVFIKLESQNIFWENISVGYRYEEIVEFW